MTRKAMCSGKRAADWHVRRQTVSSGRSATKVPERWSASLAGLPASRPPWRRERPASISCCPSAGGRATGAAKPIFHGTTLRNRDLGSGVCLAATKRITVFGTVHAPSVQSDYRREGVRDRGPHRRRTIWAETSWSAGTRMSSRCSACRSAEHDARYDFAQEWIDVVKRAWSEHDDFDFEGKTFSSFAACGRIPKTLWRPRGRSS